MTEESKIGSRGGELGATTRDLYKRYLSTQPSLHDAGTLTLGKKAHFAANIVPYISEDRVSSIADIGCGAGELLEFLRSLGYSRLAGIDASHQQTELAQKLGREMVRTGDGLEFLATHPRAYDAVIAVDVIEHIPKTALPAFFSTARAALKPNGALILQTVNGTSPFAGNYLYGDFTHETAFTARSLEQLASLTGFKSWEAREIRPSVRGFRSLARKLLWAGIAAAMRSILVIETGVRGGHIVSQNLIFVARV